MTGNLTPSTVLLLLAMAAGGLAFGLIYFATLRWTTEALGTGKGRQRAIVLSVGRVAAAVALFAGAVQLGAAALLATFAGFLLARAVMVRRARRSA